MVFFRVFADFLLSRFCFFASVFFTLPFFSHFHFFLTLSISPSPPLPHTPPFPRKRESPCDARQRRGIRAVGAGIGRFPLSREWGGGFVGFCVGCLRTLCCRVFVFSLPFFSHFHFSSTSIFSHTPHFALTPTPPHPPFPRKRESPCDARQRRGIRAVGAGIGRFPLSREWKSGGNGKGAGVEKGREWKRGRKWKGERERKGEREGRFFRPKPGKRQKKTWCGFKCGLTHFLHRI